MHELKRSGNNRSLSLDANSLLGENAAGVRAAVDALPKPRTVARALRLERFTLMALFVATDALLYWIALNFGTFLRLQTLIYADMWMLQRDRILCTGVFVVVAAALGAYRRMRLTDKFDSAYYVWLALFWSALLELVLVNVVEEKQRALSIREILAGAAVGAVIIGAERYRAASVISRLSSMRRSFHVLGEPETAARLIHEIRANKEAPGGAYYCSEELFYRIARHVRSGHRVIFPSEAILVVSPENRQEMIPLLSHAMAIYDRIFIYPALEDTFFFPFSRFSAVGGIPLIEFAPKRPVSLYLYVKRAIDITAAALGLVLALPVGVVAALAIKLTSPGPVFYSQERMGKDGKPFNLLKFRTMIPNAEAATGPVWAKSNDPRVTPVGKFLRKHRIDEIPQLINVLRGDMSLIGPRPERPHFHQEFRKKWPLFDKRLLVRPGVTSLSHVLGSYESDPSDRLRYDLLYISNLSFMMDLKILLATVRVVLGAKGAQ